MFNVDKNMQHLLTLLTKLQGCYIWYYFVCKIVCLSLKLANSLNPEFTLTLQGCYIFAMYANII